MRTMQNACNSIFTKVRVSLLYCTDPLILKTKYWIPCTVCTEKLYDYSPGGGGGTSIMYMHIGYVPRERPPFSALNFRSGAYHFHKLPPKNPFRSITILHFLADFAVQEIIIFKISSISTRSSPPTAGSARTRRVRQRRGWAGVPEIRIFTLKTDQARSGASHFHAQNGSSSFRNPTISRSTGTSFWSPCPFSLCRGTYLPNFGVITPFPLPPGDYSPFGKSLPANSLSSTFPSAILRTVSLCLLSFSLQSLNIWLGLDLYLDNSACLKPSSSARFSVFFLRVTSCATAVMILSNPSREVASLGRKIVRDTKHLLLHHHNMFEKKKRYIRKVRKINYPL